MFIILHNTKVHTIITIIGMLRILNIYIEAPQKKPYFYFFFFKNQNNLLPWVYVGWKFHGNFPARLVNKVDILA